MNGRELITASMRDLKAIKVSPKGRSVRLPRLGVKVRIADVRQAISNGSV